MSICFVTGATGFVGTALTRRLLGAGHTVRALLRDESARTRLPEGAEGLVASLGDPNTLAEHARGAELLFHCAGENDPRAAERALAWINIAGTENVINAARHAGVRRVVHLSCADVTLRNGDRLSWRETSVLTEAPLDACARSKLLAEELALHASDRELEICALRPAWIWGAGDFSTLPRLYAESLRGRVQLCGNGKNLVPTVHVENLVDAMILASRAERAPGKCYHVLDAETLDASELLGRLCSVLGAKAPARGMYALAYAAAYVRAHAGQRGKGDGLWPADVARRGRSCMFDGVAAVRDLDYEPKVRVDAGMESLATWLRELGGPSALLARKRTPASDADVDGLVRLAEAG